MKKKIIERIPWVRKFWSSDFYGLIFTGLILCFVAMSELGPMRTMICGNGYVFLYLTGRMLRKKNRGQFYSGFLTSELWAVLAVEVLNYSLIKNGLDPKIGWLVFFGIAGYYHIIRGIIHSLRGA